MYKLDELIWRYNTVIVNKIEKDGQRRDNPLPTSPTNKPTKIRKTCLPSRPSH